MTLWNEKEIPMTLQSNVRGVSIFPDIECTVLVDWGIELDNIEWKITGFRFVNYLDKETATIKSDDATHWALLMAAVDDDFIRDKLSEDCTYQRDSYSGLYHSPRFVA